MLAQYLVSLGAANSQKSKWQKEGHFMSMFYQKAYVSLYKNAFQDIASAQNLFLIFLYLSSIFRLLFLTYIIINITVNVLIVEF